MSWETVATLSGPRATGLGSALAAAVGLAAPGAGAKAAPPGLVPAAPGTMGRPKPPEPPRPPDDEPELGVPPGTAVPFVGADADEPRIEGTEPFCTATAIDARAVYEASD